ncbi:MAG TPA: invasion associated locus B family protein [Alphaproteobacteria bacterium]|jgi:hypothetical protein
MNALRVLACAALAVALALTVPSAWLPSARAAAADAQDFLGQYRDWYAYRLREGGNRTCYMVSKPIRSRGGVKQRGDVVAFVTHRPKEDERDVINFQAGYTYKPKSTVTVTIKDRSFSLFTTNDSAWARNVDDERAMIEAMINGITMEVKGMSVRGVETIDTYSLRGFTAAHKRITGACGLTPVS